MAGAGLSFVGVNGIVRHLGTELPAAQSAFIRFGFGLMFLLPALWSMRGMRFQPGVGRLFLGRGALHVVAVRRSRWEPVSRMAMRPGRVMGRPRR